MNHGFPRLTFTAASALLACAGALSPAAAAPGRPAAHPLGNFTVNYHTGLTLRPDRIDARVIVDRAEISTLQERPLVDRDHDGRIDPAETHAYAEANCSALARELRLDVADTPVGWSAVSTALTYEKGEAGLETSRLACTYTAPAELTSPTGLDLRTSYDSRRVGWREITVRGEGIQVSGTALPADSPTDELRHYPRDPATAPLDQRAAHVSCRPGEDASVATPATAATTGWPDRVQAKASAAFDSLVGTRELTLPIGLLAMLLAVVLGASHAVLPGHGKTIMASYLAGRRGTRRDAITVGATVTLTHTGGVLLLGLVLPAATHLAGETVLTWLGAASGLIVTGIGGWLLVGAVRNRPRHGHHHHHHHGHHHDEGHHQGGRHRHHHHAHEHHHHHPGDTAEALLPTARNPHTSDPARPSGHNVALATLPTTERAVTHAHHHPAPRRLGRGGLVGIGIAGGLVPSPSALVVLLGAVALGRTVFGIFLVLAYGLGMAATLTAAGLLLVRLRDRVEAHLQRHTTAGRERALRLLTRIGPAATALLVVCVGLGLTARSALGID
ncbi:nickel/cobalt transporter [Streptomyces sp. ACT015]|uniref:nickel/cobalt transporter n=1 Tax=Streptomyces sp. ACT015 TaxID=3134807 RepID=UPI003D185A24